MRKKLFLSVALLPLSCVLFSQVSIKNTPSSKNMNSFKSLKPNVENNLDVKVEKGKKIETTVLDNFKLGGEKINKIDKRPMKAVSSEGLSLYTRPEGFFMAGQSPDFYQLTSNLMFGYAYDPFAWRNKTEDALSYSWILPTPDGGTTSSTERNPVQVFPYEFYKTLPELTATFSSGTGSYKWGKGETPRFLVGGNIYNACVEKELSQKKHGACNYDNMYALRSYVSTNGNLFGTTKNYSIDGVVNVFEKSPNPYVVTDMWLHSSIFEAPAGSQLKLIVHKLKDGNFIDTIATSTVDVSNVQKIEDNLYMIPFTQYMVKEGQSGTYKQQSYLEIYDQIALELTGFNKPNVSLNILAQEFNSSIWNENNAFVFAFNSSNERILDRYENQDNTLVNTSLAFNMNVIYPFLFVNSDEDVHYFSGNGGSINLEMISYFNPNTFWSNNVPDWLNVKANLENGKVILTLEANPLPDGMQQRSAEITIHTFAIETKVKVVQNKDGNSIPEYGINDIKVIGTENGFYISYTPDYEYMAVFNMAGQKLTGLSLSAQGESEISMMDFPKGTYILKFTGQKSKSVKVIN